MQLQKHDDPTIVFEHKEDNDNKWTVWVGSERVEFDAWISAYEHMVDEVRFWIGYYSNQVEDAKEAKLTWTVEVYETFLADYERWHEYLSKIKQSPQAIHFLGGNRKLSIIARNKDDQSNSDTAGLLQK